MDTQKQLVKFISFHSHDHADFYNCIEGILTPKDIQNQIKDIFELLNVDYAQVQYQDGGDVEDFLDELANYLSQGKKVVIFTETLDINPIIFDQFSTLRDTNSFNVMLERRGKDLSKLTFPSSAKIFLIANSSSPKDAGRMRELVDHLLDLTELK